MCKQKCSVDVSKNSTHI